MMTDALLSYFHFSAVFILFAFLTVEAMVLRNPLDAKTIGLIARIDIWYVGAAIFSLVSGLLRLVWGAKGAAFYAANPVFYAKLGVFLVLGILSIRPTLQFLRWSKNLKLDAAFSPPEPERAQIRRLVMFELHIAALLPLFAVLMARGIGLT